MKGLNFRPVFPAVATGGGCLCWDRPCLFSSSSWRTSVTLAGDGDLALVCDPDPPTRFLFTTWGQNSDDTFYVSAGYIVFLNQQNAVLWCLSSMMEKQSGWYGVEFIIIITTTFFIFFNPSLHMISNWYYSYYLFIQYTEWIRFLTIFILFSLFTLSL